MYIPKNRKFNMHFRNKTEKAVHILKTSQSWQKNGYSNQMPLLGYTSDLIINQNPVLVLTTNQTNHNHSDPITKLRFGSYGIYFLQHGTISAKFIMSVRLHIARILKKKGRFWVRLCADTPVTARSAETRMGRGKGMISFWQCRVFPGQTFLEFTGSDIRTMTHIFRDLQKKTPIAIQLSPLKPN